MATKTDPATAMGAATNGHRALLPPPGQELRRKPRRRPSLIAGAVVLVLAAGLAVGLVVTRAGGKVSVIVVSRPVPAGHTISAGDLTTAQMAGDSIPAYAGNHMDEVIGKIAAVGLVKGEVLNPHMVSTKSPTPPGYVVAGVLLKPGQLPAGGVSGGDKVTVVLLTSSSQGSTNGATPTVLEGSVTVTDSASAVDGSGTVVSLLIPKGDVAQLAQANSAGLVAIAEVPNS